MNKSSDYQWIRTVLAKGTSSDKIAAYTILIQDNPVYNLKSIQDLVGMVKVSKKKECLTVIRKFFFLKPRVMFAIEID